VWQVNEMKRLVAVASLVVLACSSRGRPPSPAPAAAAHDAVEEGDLDAGDGVRLHYRKLGHGGPTVIVPGGFLIGESFDALADGRTLILYDMRNRGASSPVADDAGISIQHDVSDLEAVRRHFGVERFSPIGFSYLGMMVVLYASAHPDRVERIVQIGAVPRRFGTPYPPPLSVGPEDPGVDEAAWNLLQDARTRGLDRSDPRAFCEQEWATTRTRLVGDPAHAERLGPGHCDLANELPASLARHFQLNFGSVQRLDITDDQLRAVTMPALTIHGTRDRNAPYGGGREWAVTLRDARLLTVPGAGHQVWADDPTIVADIATFLGGGWPARAERITSVR